MEEVLVIKDITWVLVAEKCMIPHFTMLNCSCWLCPCCISGAVHASQSRVWTSLCSAGKFSSVQFAVQSLDKPFLNLVCILSWYQRYSSFFALFYCWSRFVLVLLTSDKISQFNRPCLLGLFKLASLTLSDGGQQAQSSAASEKQPAGVLASRDGGQRALAPACGVGICWQRRGGLRGAAASVLNSHAAEKWRLLLCDWHCTFSFCALGIQADSEQKLV